MKAPLPPRPGWEGGLYVPVPVRGKPKPFSIDTLRAVGYNPLKNAEENISAQAGPPPPRTWLPEPKQHPDWPVGAQEETAQGPLAVNTHRIGTTMLKTRKTWR